MFTLLVMVSAWTAAVEPEALMPSALVPVALMLIGTPTMIVPVLMAMAPVLLKTMPDVPEAGVMVFPCALRLLTLSVVVPAGTVMPPFTTPVPEMSVVQVRTGVPEQAARTGRAP
jgi:hypothetical protein